MLDLKMSDMEALDRGAINGKALQYLNAREATVWASNLRWDMGVVVDCYVAGGTFHVACHTHQNSLNILQQ